MSELNFSTELKKVIISVLREAFAVDTDYPYNKDDTSASKVAISAKYSEPKDESKLPQIIAGVSNYHAAQDTLSGNLLREEFRAGKRYSTSYTKSVSFSVEVAVISTNRYEANDIADKVFNIFDHKYFWLMEQLGTKISDLSVSEAQPRSQFPQYEYVAGVGMRGTQQLTWVITITEDSRNIFNNVKVAIETFQD